MSVLQLHTFRSSHNNLLSEQSKTQWSDSNRPYKHIINSFHWMPTKHQCWLMLILTIVLWIEYYHPHFTGGVRLRTEVLPRVERRGFQPQGTSMELPSREPVSHRVNCVEWDATLASSKTHFRLGVQTQWKWKEGGYLFSKKVGGHMHVSSRIYWLRL